MDLSDDDLKQRAEADPRGRPNNRGGDCHVVEGRPARLVGERAAGVVGSGTRCKRPSTVG